MENIIITNNTQKTINIFLKPVQNHEHDQNIPKMYIQ